MLPSREAVPTSTASGTSCLTGSLPCITNIYLQQIAPKEHIKHGNMETWINERTCHITTPPRASDYLGVKQTSNNLPYVHDFIS